MIGSSLDRAPKRRKVLEFIKAEIAAGRSFPPASVIRDHMGWRYVSSVNQCLHTMAGLDRVLIRTRAEGTSVFSLPKEPSNAP